MTTGNKIMWKRGEIAPHYFIIIYIYIFLTSGVKLHIHLLAGLGGLVGCAVRLETRRSRVQPPPRSATLFRGD